MNRILEYSPAPEEAVVSRILVMVHKAVDEHFPDAQKASRQFTKTVFSDEDFESTAINRLPGIPAHIDQASLGAESHFEAEIDTGEIPAPPEPEPKPAVVSETPETPEYSSMLDPMRGHLESEPASKILTRNDGEASPSADWLARGLGALIIAGLILLALLLLAQP